MPNVNDPVLIFALVLLILLVAPSLVARARLPSLLGLIIAGVVVGPHGLGLLARDRTFELLGTVGLLYLMFLAGLEIEMQQFIRDKRHSLVFGALTFFIPQVLGTLGAVYLLDFRWPAAILVASMFASHTLVPYGIVRRTGITKNRAVRAGIGGTILTDTAALLVLAVVVEYVQGRLVGGFWLRQMALLAACVVGILWGLPAVTRWFFRRVSTAEETEFVFILAAVFISAAAAELAGMEPIIGAFLAGLALGRFAPENGSLRNRVEFVGHALFIPFFLLSVGMLVDLRVFVSGGRSWAVMLYMTVAVVAFKWAAALLSGRLLRFTKNESWLLFGLSVNQAAATLAAVLVGHRLGIFGDPVLNGAIMMILASCLVGAVVTERHARLVADAAGESGGEPQVRRVADRILVPLSNPKTASALLDLALLLRSKASKESLYPLTVVPEGGEADGAIERAEKLLGESVRRAVGAGASAVPVARVDFNVASGILHAAAEHRASMILLGWSGRASSWNRLLRHTIHEVLMQSRALIGVFRPASPLNTVEHVWVLIPPFVEGHPGMRAVFHVVRSLARQVQGPITLVAEQSRVRRLEMCAGKPAEGVAESVEGVASWSHVAGWAVGRLSAKDIVVVVCARAGWTVWQPVMDRLPAQMSERLPETNLLVLYPSEEGGSESDAADDSPGWDLLRHARVSVGVEGNSLEQAVERVVRSCCGNDPIAGPLASELIEASRRYPVELAPGVLLLHTHGARIGATRVFFGIAASGLAVPGVESPVRVLVLVAADREQAPEEYLQTLAELTRFLQMPGVLDRLNEVSSSADLHRLVNGFREDASSD